TRRVSPCATRYCLPPVTRTAYMGCLFCSYSWDLPTIEGGQKRDFTGTRLPGSSHPLTGKQGPKPGGTAVFHGEAVRKAACADAHHERRPAPRAEARRGAGNSGNCPQIASSLG